MVSLWADLSKYTNILKYIQFTFSVIYTKCVAGLPMQSTLTICKCNITYCMLEQTLEIASINTSHTSDHLLCVYMLCLYVLSFKPPTENSHMASGWVNKGRGGGNCPQKFYEAAIELQVVWEIALSFQQNHYFFVNKKNGGRILLPALQVQVLIWTGNSSSNPEWAHGDKVPWL